MLVKLLKYDLKSLLKFLSIFYLLSIFFAVLTRIFLNIENSVIMNIIGQVCSGCTIAMIANILINNLMRVWVRFKQNLYGDEAYLTHTLPVSKKTIYLSKALTALITMIISGVVIGITLFIAYYSKENIEALKNLLLPMADIYNSSMVGIICALLGIFLLEMLNLIQVGYTGLILGHRKNNGKIGFSILFGFISYTAVQIFALLVIFIAGLFNSNIMNLFVTTDIVDMSMLKTIMYIAIAEYTASLIICYFINSKLFSKGVNVD